MWFSEDGLNKRCFPFGGKSGYLPGKTSKITIGHLISSQVKSNSPLYYIVILNQTVLKVLYFHFRILNFTTNISCS